MHALAALLAASALGLALAPPLGGDPPARERSASDHPSGTLVFLSRGNRLTSVDVASGRRTARRVPGVATCGPEIEVTGGHVVFAGFRKQRTVVFSVPVGLEQRPRELGAAHQFVRSATEGRVWLVGTDCHRSHMTGVKEITVTGRVVVSSSRRVPGTWVAGASERGLVLLRRRELFVWDPVSGRESRWPNPRSRFDRSARSFPDGVLLAKPKLGKRKAGKRGWHVELVDSRTGRSTPVPGSTTGELYPDPHWSPSSGWLFFRAGRDSLKAYRPGTDRAITIGVGWPAKAVSYVVG